MKINPIDEAEMVWIPAGDFLLGSKSDGKPLWTVYLSGYWMYKYPVTVKQFKKFTEEKPYTFDWVGRKPDWDWQDDHPMVNVSWKDAKAYCDWAQVALPTEAQWEKAARGTDGKTYPWGYGYDDAKLWCSVKTKRTGTASVYRSENVSESPFGCVDMAGNVTQWCADWYGANYYETPPLPDPTGPKARKMRVLRGGSWMVYFPRTARSIIRYSANPASWNYHWGFRAASGLP